MIHRKLHPKKIVLVPLSRVLDGTVADIASFSTDTAAWLVPNRIEEGVTFNKTGEAVDYEEETEDGVIVQMDTFKRRKGLEFTINLGRWSFEIEALMQGKDQDNVEDDQTASLEGSDDATSIKGLDLSDELTTQKFAVVLIFPENKDDGKTLYCYLPKMAISISDNEQQLTAEQQSPALTFKALGLETSDPDELSPSQDIYSKVTAGGLYFFFEGEVDAA